MVVLLVFAFALVLVAGVVIYEVTEVPGPFAQTQGGVPMPDSGPPLSLQEQQEIQAGLEQVAGSLRDAATLTAGVDQPWPRAQALKQFESCRQRVEGGAIDVTGAEEIEKVCLCALRALQKAYPGGPPPLKSPKAARRLASVELDFLGTCSEQRR